MPRLRGSQPVRRECESCILTCQHPSTDTYLPTYEYQHIALSNASPQINFWQLRDMGLSMCLSFCSHPGITFELWSPYPGDEVPAGKRRSKRSTQYNLEYSINPCTNRLRPRHLPRPRVNWEKKDEIVAPLSVLSSYIHLVPSASPASIAVTPLPPQSSHHTITPACCCPAVCARLRAED